MVLGSIASAAAAGPGAAAGRYVPFPAWNQTLSDAAAEANHDAVFLAALQSDTREFNVGAATSLPTNSSVSRKWHGMVAAKNSSGVNFLYGIPHWSQHVLEVNVTAANPTLSTIRLPSTPSGYQSDLSIGGGRWLGGALAPTNGKIYCAPYVANHVLVIDPETKLLSMFQGITASFSGTSGKWSGTVLATNGKMYCIPYASSVVLEINPSDDSLVEYPIPSVFLNNPPIMDGSMAAKWYGGVLAPNGKIYCTPMTVDRVLVINPRNSGTLEMTLIGRADGTALPRSGGSWYGGALAPNGRIYAAPQGATSVLEIDPGADTCNVYELDSTLVGNGWIGSVLAPDGNVYGIPRNNTHILKIDPGAPALSTRVGTSLTTATDKWANGAIASDGRLYCTPFTSTDIRVVGDVVGDAISGGLSENRVLSRYLNSV